MSGLTTVAAPSAADRAIQQRAEPVCCNRGFVARAPAEVVAGEHQRMARLRDEQEKVARQQSELAG